ncbi:hypothetical protein [Arvimicrobium flavum]|uniref:hypothetical protein n=1 Tax=Arvimicrobium flavum TaxID=3393320 RepID=UPI00237BBC3F|nr:hypothetical protein [Mesorhizobium shangrilense]
MSYSILKSAFNASARVVEAVASWLGLATIDIDPATAAVNAEGLFVRADPATGLTGYYNKQGQLHRENGPALVVRDPVSGVVTAETWCQNGRPWRDDGPAEIKRDAETGVTTFEGWWQGGKPQRLDGPAEITRDAKTGVATYEAWRKDGQPHRDGGPALTVRDADTGVATREEYWQDGEQVAQRPARSFGGGPKP